MADESMNTASFDQAAGNDGAGAEASKPARAPRKRREAPASEDASVKKPTRTRAAAASSSTRSRTAEVTAEVAQARALAQISQASLVRKQRRVAALAEETIADASVERPRRRTRKATEATSRAGVLEQPGLAAEALAPAAPVPAASAEQAAPERRKRAAAPKRTRRAAGDASEDAASEKPRATEEPAVSGVGASPEVPALESPAAPEAAAEKAPRRKKRAAEAEAGSDEEARPRKTRSRKKAASDAGGAADGVAPQLSQAEVSGEPREEAAGSEAPAKPADDAGAPAEGEASEAKDVKPGRRGREQQQGVRRTHAQRSDQHSERSDRRTRQQNRKNRNNRSAPAEPSLSREELAAMKVAELREKARELDLDVAGKKKAELVEEVYTAAARAEGFREITGILDIAHEGFGHIRAHGYLPSRDDAFVPANLIRAARLRSGDVIEGSLRPSRPGDKFPGLAKITSINGMDPDAARQRPKFGDLTPIYPNEQLKMEHGKDSITGRAIDIVSPIGKGQRGLIVSPPKAGKTTILKKICQSIAINNPEVHLICLLVDERPEEVTDMQRSIKGEVVASTFDMPADNHTRVSELVIERAKRIVEMGGDVVVVLDSITRLARAYNLAAPASGRILSGGVDSAALYPPKKFLGAARNIENGGSLTILASALVETGSKMDEVIFEEFKGTGNMELKLDRELADRRIFPAIDPVASGTRNEDLLLDEQTRPFVWGIRRVLANMSNTERCASAFIKGLKQTNSNAEFLIRSAKRAQDRGESF